MNNIAPVFYVDGIVRRVMEREVAAVEARPAEPAQPAQRDADGFVRQEARPARPAVEARDGYTAYDVMIDTGAGLTVEAGFITVSFVPLQVADGGGYIPSLGDIVERLPVRGYTKWAGPQNRRYSTNGYSFYGDAYSAMVKARTSGRSLAATG